MHKDAINTTMKKILSLILCFAMVLGMMPAVLAAPVLEAVESVEVEETVAEEAEAGLAEDVTAYAAKQTAFDATMGILVYFNNGNAEDKVNLTNAELVGYNGTSVVGGYPVWDMNKAETFQSHSDHRAFGLYTGDPSAAVTYTTIGYSDGSAMNGKLYFRAETYGNHTAASGIYRAAVNNRADNNTWGNGSDQFMGTVRTDWWSASIPAGDWGTAVNDITICDTLSFVGLFRQAANADRYKFRSVYMYYMPTNNVKLYEGETLVGIEDLGTENTWTVEAPANSSYDAWKDASGNVYKVNDTVAAGTALTAYKLPEYAEKTVADLDETKGILVYYNNGNAADKVNLTNAELVGYNGTSVVDGYYAWDMLKDEVFQGHGDHQVFGVYTGDPDAEVAYKTIGYADDSAMNGMLYFRAEVYNSDTANNKTMLRSVVTQKTLTTIWGSAAEQNLGSGISDWWSSTLNKGAWSTAVCDVSTHDTLSFVGVMRAQTHAVYYSIRSAYMYYMPTNNVKLYEGETLVGIEDLGTEETWTVEAPANTAYNAWKDASGKYYFVGDTAAAGTVLTAAYLNEAAMPAKLDETKGVLIWYNGFKNSLTEGDFTAEGWTFTTDLSKNVYTKVLEVVDGKFVGKFKAAWGEGYKLNVTHNEGKDGIYTAVFNYYAIDASNQWASWNGTNYQQWDGAAANTWGTMTSSTSSAINTLTEVWFRSGSNSTNYTYYLDSVAIYYMPKNYVKFVVDGESEIIDLEGETSYTAPALPDATYNAWVSTEGYCYLPGSEIHSGKTVSPATVTFAEKPAATHETYGDLIYFDNFSGAEFDNAAIEVIGTSHGTVNGGVYGVQLEKDAANSFVTQGVVVKPASGTWAENGYEGEITLVIDVASNVAKKFWTIASVNPGSPFWGWNSTWFANSDNAFSTVAGEFATCAYTYDADVIGSGMFGFTRSGDDGATNTLKSIAVYHKAPESYAPVTLNVSSMRKITPQGLRIAGFVTNAIKAAADEYGFVVARADQYTDATQVVNGAANTITAATYVKGEKDSYYVDASEDATAANTAFGEHALDENGWYFTGVYVNVPMNATALQTKLICRTYVKIGDTYFYGEPVAKSVYEVAETLCNKYGEEAPDYAKQVYDIVNAVAE